MRSLVVVLPASTWAMMPMLRSLSSMVLAGRGCPVAPGRRGNKTHPREPGGSRIRPHAGPDGSHVTVGIVRTAAARLRAPTPRGREKQEQGDLDRGHIGRAG